MGLKIRAAKNVGSGWFALGTDLLIGFFLAPFMLHKLGDAAYGLYMLILSLVGYYGLFDFGIRSSIVRYVARFTAMSDDENLSRLLNTSLFCYSVAAVVLLLVTGVGFFYVDSLFRISPPFLNTARVLFLVAGAGIALGFPLSIFGGALEGLQKFYVINLTRMVTGLARAVLTVIALNRGFGLLAVTLITVGLSQLGSVVRAVITFRYIPLQLKRKYINKASFHLMTSYGWKVFVMGIAENLRFRTDNLVIGFFLSPTAITLFAIGSKLVLYPTRVVQKMAEVLTPMSSHFDATGDMNRLQRIFVVGNRACALVIFPMCTTLIILGKSIIEVWVGSKYVSSYSVMLILAISMTLYHAQGASTRILFGMGRHGWMTAVRMAEGGANLLLSILLVRRWGIVGDALGTAIPLACTSLVFFPSHLCRVLNFPLLRFLRRAYLPPLALCAPLTVSLLFLRHLFQARTYLQLGAQVLAGGLVYGASLLWFLLTREPMTMELGARFKQLLQHAFSR